MRRAFLATSLWATALAFGACTVHQTDPTALTGPSGFATSLTITATPDRITQDGASSSKITVTARTTPPTRCAFIPIRLDMAVSGVLQDFGTLSGRNIVTGTDCTAN